MSSINKAIIPAAGLGKRMRPLTSYLPKPMLPLGKKPVLEHIVDEVKASGITDILIITRSDHRSVINYFGDKSNITIKIDDSAGGPGQAILEGSDFIGEDPFIVVFADAPLEGRYREQAINSMIEAFQNKSPEALLSIYPVTKREATYRGIVKGEEKIEATKQIKITNIKEKPEELHTSHPWASTCRYILKTEIFDALRSADRDENGELQLTAGIKKLLDRNREVIGVPLPKGIKRHDTGNFEGYFEAFARFTDTNF